MLNENVNLVLCFELVDTAILNMCTFLYIREKREVILKKSVTNEHLRVMQERYLSEKTLIASVAAMMLTLYYFVFSIMSILGSPSSSRRILAGLIIGGVLFAGAIVTSKLMLGPIVPKDKS